MEALDFTSRFNAINSEIKSFCSFYLSSGSIYPGMSEASNLINTINENLEKDPIKTCESNKDLLRKARELVGMFRAAVNKSGYDKLISSRPSNISVEKCEYYLSKQPNEKSNFELSLEKVERKNNNACKAKEFHSYLMSIDINGYIKERIVNEVHEKLSHFDGEVFKFLNGNAIKRNELFKEAYRQYQKFHFLEKEYCKYVDCVYESFDDDKDVEGVRKLVDDIKVIMSSHLFVEKESLDSLLKKSESLLARLEEESAKFHLEIDKEDKRGMFLNAIWLASLLIPLSYIVICTTIFLCQTMPQNVASYIFSIILIGPLFGFYRFLTIPTGIAFYWPEAVQGLYLPPWLLTVLCLAFLAVSIVFILLRDNVVYGFYFTSEKTKNFALVVITGAAFLGIFSTYLMLAVQTSHYLQQLWGRPFWGVVVGILYAFVRYLALIIGTGYWGPGLYDGILVGGAVVNTTFFAGTASFYILIGILMFVDEYFYKFDDEKVK